MSERRGGGGVKEDEKYKRATTKLKFVPLNSFAPSSLGAVINGNYRTSLAGVDLNRRWDKPDPILHPTIHAVKEMVRKFQKTREVVLQTDIHGHR